MIEGIAGRTGTRGATGAERRCIDVKNFSGYYHNEYEYVLGCESSAWKTMPDYIKLYIKIKKILLVEKFQLNTKIIILVMLPLITTHFPHKAKCAE